MRGGQWRRTRTHPEDAGLPGFGRNVGQSLLLQQADQLIADVSPIIVQEAGRLPRACSQPKQTGPQLADGLDRGEHIPQANLSRRAGQLKSAGGPANATQDSGARQLVQDLDEIGGRNAQLQPKFPSPPRPDRRLRRQQQRRLHGDLARTMEEHEPDLRRIVDLLLLYVVFGQ
jgi:hypothetical protein